MVVNVIKLVDANKAKAAFLVPLLLAAAGALGSWIVTGEFNAAEIRLAAQGTVLAVAAGIAAYVTKARQAVVEPRGVVATPGAPPS